MLKTIDKIIKHKFVIWFVYYGILNLLIMSISRILLDINVNEVPYYFSDAVDSGNWKYAAFIFIKDMVDGFNFVLFLWVFGHIEFTKNND